MNRKITYIAFVTIGILLQACGKRESVQYGEAPLVMDHSVFDLNIDIFFQDESIFRGAHNTFSVSSEDHRLENDSLMPGFIQYSTRAYSRSRVLARYAATDFEDLGLITDWDDTKVLMAYAGTEYASAADVDRMIARLNQEPGTRPTWSTSENFGRPFLNLDYRKDGKLTRLCLELPGTDFIDRDGPERNTDKTEVLFTPEIRDTLIGKLKEMDRINCRLFVVQDIMDSVMENLGSRSGFLVYYDE